jgi:thiol-disulfide isomerase/thioredoxin
MIRKGFKNCLLVAAGAVCFLNVLIPIQSFAQGWEERFQWGLKQQKVLTAYVNEHPPDLPLSPIRVDDYFQTLNEIWQEEIAEDTARWKSEVSPYLYYFLLRMQVVKEALDDEVRCHLFAEHMVPTFLDDVKRYREEPATDHLYPISSGTNLILNVGTFDCEIPTDRWSSLQSALEQLPDLIRSHLERNSDLSDRAQGGLKRSQDELERLQPLVSIRGALYQSNLDEAFAKLAAISTEGELAHHVRLLGKQLWRRYEKADKADKALATLDLLAHSLTTGDLSRDSLRTWYSAVDPEHGPERFQRITGASSPPPLAPAEQRIELTGTYLDLTTGEPFDLATLKGKAVLLDFWATWCAPCIEEIPELKRLISEHDDDFVLVSVSSDPVTGGAKREKVREFIEKHGITYTALYDDPDTSLTERFEVTSWPSKFLISENGQIMKHPTDEARLNVTLEEVEAYLKSQN